MIRDWLEAWREDGPDVLLVLDAMFFVLGVVGVVCLVAAAVLTVLMWLGWV